MPAADSGFPAAAPSALAAGHKLTLHLGVVDQPYRTGTRKSKPMSTGDVASILEAKYGVMQAFYNWQEKAIGDAIAKSVESAIEMLVTGHAVDPYGEAMQNIQERFRDFINSGMAERVGLRGVPTAAALHGVNHRLRHPYRSSNPRRPSFRDTGLYQNSFRAWAD